MSNSNPTNETPQDEKPETPTPPVASDKPEYKPDYEYDVYERERGDFESSFHRFCDYRGNNRY